MNIFSDPIYLAYFLFGLGILGLIFLIFRAFILWYWGIQEIISKLNMIEKNTRKEEPKVLPETTVKEPIEK